MATKYMLNNITYEFPRKKVTLKVIYNKTINLLNRKKIASSKLSEKISGFYRMVWEEAAKESGLTVKEVHGNIIEINCNPIKLRIKNNYTSLDDPVTLDIAGNKPLVYKMLMERNLPVPIHALFHYKDLSIPFNFMKNCSKDCVIKPAYGTSGGSGITTGIRNKKQLVNAISSAGAYCDEIIIEEQVEGSNYRILYLDGKMLDVVKRIPVTIVGDGQTNIIGLINMENNIRLSSNTPIAYRQIRVDEDMKNSLIKYGYSLRSIPKAKERIIIKNVINDNKVEDNYSATHQLCQSIISDGADAAGAVGARLAGVDVITTDPGIPLRASGGAIIEVNTTPSFLCHYNKHGEKSPVANYIIKELVKSGLG